MNKLTQKSFARLSLPEKVNVYFSHQSNMRQGKGNSEGPTVECQGKYFNDWQLAFFDFKQNLPAS